MRLLIALLLNGLLLLAAGGWLRRERRVSAAGLRRWLLPALAARLLLTALSAARPSPDAQYLSRWAAGLTADIWARPAAIPALLLSHEVRAGGEVLSQYALSNNIFFIKILSLLNLASLGNLFLNALYLSAFCFVGCWSLVRVWGRTFPGTPPGAPLVAFLLWPSVLWWTAGLTKETVLLGAEAALVALVLPGLFAGRTRGAASAVAPMGASELTMPSSVVSHSLSVVSSAPARAKIPTLGKHVVRWGSILLLSALAVRMRYFFALPLLGALLTVAAGRGLTRRGWVPAGRRAQLVLTLGLLLGGGALGWWGISALLPPGFISQQLYAQYEHGVATSPGRPHLSFPGLAPTGASLLAHAPAAVAQVFTRPWLGESGQLLYLAAALENLLLLSLLVLSAYALGRGKGGRLPLPLVLALLGCCLLLAAFIGLSTPNLGTLHRYRAALLPWLLVLLLQNDYARRWARW